MKLFSRSVVLAFSWVASIAFLAADVVAGERWVPAWVSAQQLTEPGNMPPEPGLARSTLRQVVQPTLSGGRVRVTFSNEYGDRPVRIRGTRIAVSKGASSIDPASDRSLTFSGRHEVTVLPGVAMTSDDVDFAVTAFENLAVSVLLEEVPEKLTGHPGSRTTSYFQLGDSLSAGEMPEARQTDHWYLLASIEVSAVASAAAIVVIGDSITDGRGSTTNENDRWPNLLARRLHETPSTRVLSVLNQGAGGGRVLRDGLGDSALRRFDRDVLALPGVKWVVLFSGVNDLGTAVGARAHGGPAATAQDLIDGYRQMLLRARSHGIRVIGCTIMPFQGFAAYDTPESEKDRNAVNDWIRNSGEFDGVIDFDAITRDPEQPARLSAAVDGGDHLHPSAAGYRLMAEAIDLRLFRGSNR